MCQKCFTNASGALKDSSSNNERRSSRGQKGRMTQEQKKQDPTCQHSDVLNSFRLVEDWIYFKVDYRKKPNVLLLNANCDRCNKSMIWG